MHEEEIILLLVKSLTEEIDKRIARCERDCRDLLIKVEEFRSKFDGTDVVQLKDKLDNLLQELQELKIASVVEDVKHNHQLAEILRRIDLEEEAKLVEQGRPIINVNTNNTNTNLVADKQQNQIGDKNKQNE